MDITLEEKLTKARSRTAFRYPFFASLMWRMKEVIVENTDPLSKDIPTAATDGNRILYNRTWCDKITQEEMVGVIVHEVLHAAHSHTMSWRKGYRDHKKWNHAADYVVNNIITEEGIELPKGCLLDDKYKGFSTEEVYEKLPDNEDSGGGSGSGKGKSKGQAPLGGDLQDPCNDDGSGMTAAEEQQLSREWEETIIGAAQMARMQGKLPKGMARLLDDLENPRIPWYEMLDNLVGEVLQEDYDFSVADRRFLQQGIYLPDLYSEGAMVAVAIDTSGSIGLDDMKLFLSEAIGILGSKNVTRIRLMCCDAAVTFDKIINIGSAIPGNLPGGGGTDFRPVFNRIAHANEKPAALVYLTDLCGTFPEDPGYPVIWVAYKNEGIEAPFGVQIDYNPTDEEMKTFHANGTTNGHDFGSAQDDQEQEDPEEYQGE